MGRVDSGGIWPGDESYFQNIRETALQDTIEQLTKELAEKDRQLAEARAEIERLRARNAILDNAIAEMTEEQSALCAEGQTITELVAAKNKQIEQMQKALRLADDLIDDYAMVVDHCDNVDEVRDMIKAVLEAAERASKT